MYNFSSNKMYDTKEALACITQHPFACITGSFLSGKQVATQIPFLYHEKNGEHIFQAHIMQNTDHHKAFIENPNVLIVFSGPSCYVSASWYKNPNQASTWNYMSVHVSGKIRFMWEDELVTFMQKLTLQFEQGNTQSSTYFNNLPKPYLSKLMPAIIGIEIKAEQIEPIFKLSQDKDEASYMQIISNLQQIGGDSGQIASEMLKRKSSLFPNSNN